MTLRPSRTTLLFVTAAAVVIVVGGIKAANHIVGAGDAVPGAGHRVPPAAGPVREAHAEMGGLRHRADDAVVLLLSLAIAVAVSIGQLAKLIPTYATR